MQEIAWLKDLIPQAPGLVVAGFLAWLFLRHMEKREVAFNEMIKDIHNDNIEARINTRAAMDACTRALTENSLVGTRQTAMIEKMLDKLSERE